MSTQTEVITTVFGAGTVDVVHAGDFVG